MNRAVRVLLIHANPFQGVTPVPAYGLERVRSALPDEVVAELVDPYLVSETPIEAAVEAARRMQPDVVGLGLRVVDDCIVVDRLEAPSGQQIDVTWFLPEIRKLRDAVGAAVPDALVVAGGAAFSAFPQECLGYLGIEHGVVGAGEAPFRELVAQVARGSLALAAIPGVVRRGGGQGISAYAHGDGVVTRRHSLYAPANGFPVRTRIGCAMQCAYCLTANLLRSHSNFDLEPVLAEIESMLAEARTHGIGRVPLFFADDELNLPDERHPLELLRGLRERGLEGRLTWRAYFNPTPFSLELAELVKSTNGHASITVDTAAEVVMERSQKPFRRRHLDRLAELLVEHDVPADMGFIFGLPGETEETLAETIAFIRALPPSIEVAYSAGARVYPNTPLAAIARSEPELLVGSDDPEFLAPVVYSSPVPPRDLARRLADSFADLPHVQPVGVGFGSGRRTLAQAYRCVLRGGRADEWRSVLELAEKPGDYQRKPGESLAACMQVAVWHSRFDLAAQACGRLLRAELPPEVSRAQVRMARLAYGGIAAFDRFTRRRQRKVVSGGAG